MHLFALLLFAPLAATTPGDAAATAEERALAASAAKRPADPAEAPGGKMPSSTSVFMITPRDRIEDLVRAFSLLSAERSSSKVVLRMEGGAEISNVISIRALPSGTMVMIRYNSPKGIQYFVAGVEDIEGIFLK